MSGNSSPFSHNYYAWERGVGERGGEWEVEGKGGGGGGRGRDRVKLGKLVHSG